MPAMAPTGAVAGECPFNLSARCVHGNADLVRDRGHGPLLQGGCGARTPSAIGLGTAQEHRG